MDERADREVGRINYGQRMPSAAGRRMPGLADHVPFIEENRARATIAAGRPSSLTIERVWWKRSLAELRTRLGSQDLAVWTTGDVLHILWRGATGVMLFGGVQQMPLWRVADTDLWEISLRVASLDQALISINLLDETFCPVAQSVFRGIDRPPMPTSPPPPSALRVDHIPSRALGTARTVTTYRHPHAQRDSLVVLLADGGNVAGFAPYVHAAIDNGHVRPLTLVGIHATEARHHEYLPPAMYQAMAAHLPAGEAEGATRRHAAYDAFITDELPAWLATELDADANAALLQGNSNGASWALDTCQRHPDRYHGALAFSVAAPGPAGIVQHTRHAYVLAAGTLEPFRATTLQWAQQLTASGHEPVHHRERVSGHDWLFWAEELPLALADLAPA